MTTGSTCSSRRPSTPPSRRSTGTCRTMKVALFVFIFLSVCLSAFLYLCLSFSLSQSLYNIHLPIFILCSFLVPQQFDDLSRKKSVTFAEVRNKGCVKKLSHFNYFLTKIHRDITYYIKKTACKV